MMALSDCAAVISNSPASSRGGVGDLSVQRLITFSLLPKLVCSLH
jgi:hypothetical protein